MRPVRVVSFRSAAGRPVLTTLPRHWINKYTPLLYCRHCARMFNRTNRESGGGEMCVPEPESLPVAGADHVLTAGAELVEMIF